MAQRWNFYESPWHKLWRSSDSDFQIALDKKETPAEFEVQELQTDGYYLTVKKFPSLGESLRWVEDELYAQDFRTKMVLMEG